MFKKTGIIASLIFICVAARAQDSLFVSPVGNDANSGTAGKPFKTVQKAIDVAKGITGGKITIEIRRGIYRPDKTIGINAANNKSSSITIRAYKSEKVIFSGARPILLKWTPSSKGIFEASLDVQDPPDRLYYNGVCLPMARYPNFDPAARVFNGTAADAISDERVNRWKDPTGGYIHALHNGEWGDFHYRVTGKSADGKLNYAGGWQNNRPAPMHKEYRFVENIFEELDTPGEWYYDAAAKIIYLYPPRSTNIYNAKIEIGQLSEIMQLKGEAGNPLKNISIRDIEFEHTDRTFMLTREPLLRSDWAIYRGGAILLNGTENISIRNCIFHELGGNAIFLSNYNKRDTLSGNHMYNIGASAIAFVGNPEAVRSPAFRYEEFVPWEQMDYTPGAQKDAYPQYCVAADNLIHHIGQIEKQVSGVQIEMASHITVSHNTIYNTPRSGINVGDGCWGGHLLEYNDVFNTVLETGDHGAFNSWGRDRFWRPERDLIDSIVAAKPGIELLDVIEPNILRNNRFQCDHGWDIDLDDGSTNYRIYNNVCLSGGLKLREGYHRAVFNNIIINNTFHPHVWLQHSDDIFVHNIVAAPYAPIGMENWGNRVDSNFFLSEKGLRYARSLGLDAHGSAGDALFMDDKKGNYRVKTNSPALQTGFQNIAMDFGVSNPSLKKIAAKPFIHPLLVSINKRNSVTATWLGATIKDIETLGERSATGLPDNNGVMLITVPVGSLAAINKLQKGDVLIKLGDEKIDNTTDLLQVFFKIKWMGSAPCILVRNQAQLQLPLSFKD